MTSQARHSQLSIKHVGIRVGALCLGALLIAFTLYFFAATLSRQQSGYVTLTALFGIPYVIGVLVAYFSEMWRMGSAWWASVIVLLFVHIVGAITLKEGVICIAMLVVIWYPCVLLGVGTVRFMFNRFEAGRVYSALALVFPALLLVLDATLPLTTQSRSVVRDIVIDAPAAVVWQNLHDIPAITEADGRWNITQDVLHIPRPVAAKTAELGQADVRTNIWAGSIAFEEHITEAVEAKRLHWRFFFPDDSIKHKTDRHLDPDSHYFTIETGGFDLTPMGEGQTRLTLHTRYSLSTPVNGYAAAWGEFMLGDIQNNVLAIVKTRSTKGQNDAAL